MPKTTKPFDWEIYDENGEFLDILTMTRDESKEYQKTHPNYTLTEIGYNDDGGDDSWETDSKKGWDIHSLRIPKRHRRLEDVY